MTQSSTEAGTTVRRQLILEYSLFFPNRMSLSFISRRDTNNYKSSFGIQECQLSFARTNVQVLLCCIISGENSIAAQADKILEMYIFTRVPTNLI